MNQQAEHSEKKSRAKWPWIVLLCIVAVIGIARLALMSGPVQRWVKNTIEDTANNQLKPRLSIGELSGDLWNSATLTNVVLTEDSTVASVDTLHLEYSPLSYFSDSFKIHEIRVTNPFLKLQQQKDSTFNVQNWVTSTDTTSSTFAVSVSNLLIENGRLDVNMPTMQADSTILVDELNLAGSLGYFGSSYSASIADFGFKIKHTRLNSSVSFSAAAQADESSITLEKLAIATGNSMLSASGRAGLADSTINFEAHTDPLGWQDVAAFIQDAPVREDVNIDLQLKGNADQFDAQINVNAQGIENLALKSSFSRDSVLALRSFTATAGRIDLETFMGDTAMPRLQDFDFRANGRMPLDAYQQASLEGTLSARDLHQGSYSLSALQGTFSLQNGDARIHIEPVKENQRLIADANLSAIWSDGPAIDVQFRGSKINPATWLPDQQSDGSLTFSGEVQGTGWFPDQKLWDYQLTVNQSSLMGQQLDKATLRGRFNGQKATNQSTIDIASSKLRLQAEVSDFQSTPAFSYILNADSVNIADFSGMENYPSLITGTLKGSGRGSSLENLQMQTSMEIDSSLFKGESIQELSLSAQIDGSIVTIQQAGLASAIADGNLSGRLNMQDLYDADNTMDLDMQIKDLSSLAPLVGADILLATGRINGTLTPAAPDTLIFNGMLDLSNVNYNNQFIAQTIDGGLRVELENQPRFIVDVNIGQPTISSVELKNIGLKTEGQLGETSTDGSFEINLFNEKEGQISQAGTYRIGEDTTAVELTTFDLTTALRTLSLQKPFHASYSNGALQTDTLHISSDDDSTFMELAVPYADTLRQHAYLKGERLNLSAIQNTIFNEPFFEGRLFGEIEVNRSDTSLTASGDIVMADLVYQQTALDTLRLWADIQNDRLTGSMKLHQNGELIAEGNADIPFETKSPDQLDEAFFEKPVSGRLKLHALRLERFNTLLEQAGYADTKGIVQFDGTLEGQAGSPQLDARMSLKEAEFSGVPVDSLIASMDYRHPSSILNLNATLTSLQQKALDVDAQMPLKVDMHDLSVALPGPQDSISVDIVTNQFNLKALNSFLSRDMTRNLQGRLDGTVKIMGPRNDLQTSGEVTLRKGAIRVVPAGIRLDNIESTIQLQPDKIVLANLRMKSGSGQLTAKGELGLEKLVPGDLDIRVDAKNFKAANTKQYNALINLGLQVDGSVTQPNIKGKLDVLNGFVELDNFGEKSVEQIQLDTTAAPETSISMYDSLSLNMDIEFNRRFFVRNQRYLEMEIELDGQLDILKDAGQDMQLFGTLTTARGYARPLGKRFELEEGSLAFSGPPDNPQINIRTLYEPPQAEQEIKIWYVIEGTVEDPQFKYESSPPMDLAGIISYTLFGQPFYKLNPAEQTVASSSSNNAAADFAMEVLLDRVEAIATRRLGIDVVRIENTRVGGDSGTSVTTGWYINPKVFFAIQNVITGSTPTTGFFLEYYLKENLKLILSQGNDNRQGVDVQWEYDY